MTKNVFDLITAIVSAVEIAADGIFTFLAALASWMQRPL